MNRWGLVLVLVAALLRFAVHAGAATPEGPRLTIVASGGLITTGPLGEDLQVLDGDPRVTITGLPSWSADGSHLAFAADVDKRTVVGVLEADGTGLRTFPRAALISGEPVMAPDGRSVAFQRLKAVKTPPGSDSPFLKSSIWVLDVEDGSVRRLTRWRGAGFLYPISYSPDGSALVAIYLGYPRLRIVAVDLQRDRIRPLALLGDNEFGPTYSPDGSRLALVRVKYLHTSGLLPARPVSELLVARADGSGASRLLRKKGYISFPSWDPSGSRLAFTRSPPAKRTDPVGPSLGNKVMEINADGTCLRKVFSNPKMTVYGSAWQPGPGREAGPISC